MGETGYPHSHEFRIPAKCFNLASLARSRSGGRLQIGLPGLSDNVIFLSASNWRCWNRKLNQDLISWRDFRNGHRTALHDPVACTLILHHSYSRTVIHRVYDSLITACRKNLDHQPAGEGRLHRLFG